ncbi:PP2C family protein-serine/threonine phosphatase [Noviherbaspirillum sp.]|uniref:PP2C family protein-serine/threonine phosphatase n=1 Tax=Noviherbaspirillum sp. TaxID=1926288 RepID=UPI002FE0EBCC
MDLRVSALSRAGGRDRNEDACGYLEMQGIVCCVLADGAGGHRGGDVASRICVQTVLEEFGRRPEVSTAAVSQLLNCANESVLKQQRRDASLSDMRSTLVVLLLDPGLHTAAWGHVGDSRLYMFKNGAIHFRTCDHSLIQTMVASGLIQEKDAEKFVERNVLIASAGSIDDFQPSVIEAPCKLNDGDAFLLCSDGVWNLVPDTNLEQSLGRAASPETWLADVESLVARHICPESDNYTALGIWCGDVTDNMRTVPAPCR